MKKWSGLNQERNLHRSSSVYKPKHILAKSNGLKLKNILMLDLFQLLSSQDVNWWTGVVWIIVMFLSAVWTLILTAPIQCRESIVETVMQCYISPNLMKKQTHLHLGCPEGEYMFIKWSFLGELFLKSFLNSSLLPMLTKHCAKIQQWNRT